MKNHIGSTYSLIESGHFYFFKSKNKQLQNSIDRLTVSCAAYNIIIGNYKIFDKRNILFMMENWFSYSFNKCKYLNFHKDEIADLLYYFM